MHRKFVFNNVALRQGPAFIRHDTQTDMAIIPPMLFALEATVPVGVYPQADCPGRHDSLTIGRRLSSGRLGRVRRGQSAGPSNLPGDTHSQDAIGLEDELDPCSTPS
eukprot:1506891-Pleurochrysis_carterae.AAC.2